MSEPGTIAALRKRSSAPLGVFIALFVAPLTILVLTLPWYLLLVVATHTRTLLAAW